MTVRKRPIKSDLKQLDAMTDDDIDYSDTPAFDDGFLRNVDMKFSPGKKPVTLRLDADVLAWVADALADPAIDGVYGDLEYVARADPDRVIRHWKAGAYSTALLRRGWMPPHPTLYLRREVFIRAGLYDTSFRIAGDYDGMLRFMTRGEVRLAYIPKVMVRMKMGGASNKSFAHMIRKSREDYRAIRRHGVGGFGTLVAKNLSKLPQFLGTS